MQDQLNTAIAALVAAISNQATATTVDVSATKKVDYVAVNDSHALFGDHSPLLVAQVMDGTTYHAFIGQNLQNSQSLFQAGNVRVVDILGRTTVVTDPLALYSAASTEPDVPAKRREISLTANAATVHDSRDIIGALELAKDK